MQSNKNSNKIFHTFLIVMFLLCPTQLLLSQPFFQQASFNLPFRMSLGVIRSAYVPAQHAIYILGGYEDQVGYSDKIIKVDLNSEQVSVLSTHLPFALQSDLTLIQVAYNNNDGNIYFFNKFDAYSFDPQTENISLIGSNISPEQVVYGISKYVSSQNAIYSFGNRGSSGGNFTLKYDITNNTVDPLTNTMQPGNNTSPAAAYCQSRDAIYLFGGNHSSFSFDIIQKFDPVSEIFTTLPISLPTIAGAPAAVAVPSENAIYVFGGYDNSQNLDDVFKFDCSTETLQVMPDLPIALNSMGVEYVPSENRIYILGGTTARTGGYTPATDAVYYIQLQTPPPPLDTSEVTIQWQEATPFTAPHGRSYSEVIGRKIYVPSGGNAFGGYNFTALSIYDVDSDTWSSGQNIPSAKAGNSETTVLNGKLYQVGGEGPNAGRWSPEFEEYDPSSNSWSFRANWQSPRRDIGVGTIGDKIYVVGGHNNYSNMSSGLDIYDYSMDLWGNGQNYPIQIDGAAVIAFNGKLYSFGGHTGPNQGQRNITNRAFCYDPITDQWNELSSMPIPRAEATVGVYNGKIYILGGAIEENGQFMFLQDDVLEYSPSEDQYRVVITQGFYPFSLWAYGKHTPVLDNEIFLISSFAKSHETDQLHFEPKVQRGQFISPNSPPTANAGQDSTYECTSTSDTDVTLNASLSSDPDNDPLTYTWREDGDIIAGPTTDSISVVALGLDSHEIELTVDDGAGGTDTDEVLITVVDITPPVITLNGDNPLTLECPLPYEEPGAQVSDLCDPNPVLVITGNVDTNVPGNYTITYTATDASNNSASMQRTVNVVDTTPPVIAINPDIITLWPPNHKYETISVEQAVVSVSDVCDVDLSINDVLIVSVSSDEPEDANGNGDGKTFNDIVIADDCKSVQLRKERQGGGNGRVYTIHFEAVDHSGNPATASYQVQVPHDKKDIAMDEGPAYTVLGNCSIPSALIASNIEENQDGINDVESKLDEKQLNAETNFDKSQDLDETKLLNGYQLYQNHPNPFNPTTEITFALPKAVNVSLVIYNLSGQLVRTLVSGQFPTGVHRVTWNATDDNGIRVASGMYLYVLKAGQYMDKKKLLLMK